MHTTTRQDIIDLVIKKGKVRPKDVADVLGFHPTGVHRHLKKLVADTTLSKVGSPPNVYYVLAEKPLNQIDAEFISPEKKVFLGENYQYFTPEGENLSGLIAFYMWMKSTQQLTDSYIDNNDSSFDIWVASEKEQKRIVSLINEYSTIRKQSWAFKEKKTWIDATDKFNQTFDEVYVDTVYYQDFYSLPKFGKTKLGQFVLHAKQSQSVSLLKYITKIIKPVISELIDELDVDAIAYIPHSIPRKVPFLKYVQSNLAFSKDTYSLVKAYRGEIPVAQKSLTKLSERVTNAEKSIFIEDREINVKSILIIDDAVGSGATFNEVAKKLKKQYGIEKVYGYAIVGSMKGFEVIQEV